MCMSTGKGSLAVLKLADLAKCSSQSGQHLTRSPYSGYGSQYNQLQAFKAYKAAEVSAEALQEDLSNIYHTVNSSMSYDYCYWL